LCVSHLARHTGDVQTWKRYWLHLAVAVLAALGAASGLADTSSAAGAAFWLLCLGSALYNAALFGVGWERRRGSHEVVRELDG
jgi:hypothetical protein